MNQKITSFYRLTKPEKERLVEQCRKRIEEEKIRDAETVRKILEELLAEKWDKKKKTAQTEMQKMLDELQRQVTEAQEKERRTGTDAADLRKKLAAAEAKNSELQSRLTAAEARNSELNGDLALAGGKANLSQERLKSSEERVIRLSRQLETAEGEIRSLKDQLENSSDTNDSLRSLYTASDTAVGDLRKKLSESARTVEDLKESLKEKESEANAYAAAAQESRKEVKLLEKKLAEEVSKGEKESFTSWRSGLLIGLVLAAALCVIVFPTHYVTDLPVPAEQNSGISGTYTGGGNRFDRFSGFGELAFDDGTVCRGFWANGWSVYATEYVFPDGGVYSGNMWLNMRPCGAGTYTRPDGEKAFGIWTWATEKTLRAGPNEEEYVYTGPLRFGEPYGYGEFDGSGEGGDFVGEYYDDGFRNGTWYRPDGREARITSN